MMKETESIVHMTLDFLPLRTYDNIHEGNALHMDWREVLPPTDNVRVMGNPPFVGKKEQSKEQKRDLLAVFNHQKGLGNLDYRAAAVYSDWIRPSAYDCQWKCTHYPER